MTIRRLLALFVLFTTCVFANYSYALLNLELTRGVAGAVPIAVVPFALQGSLPPHEVSEIIGHDLQMSGRFKVYGRDKLSDFPSTLQEVRFGYFRSLSADNIVIGKINEIGPNRYQVSFQLLDAYKGKDAPQQAVMLSRKYVVSGGELRSLAHHISDLIYEQITGVKGIFSTRLAYVVVQRAENGSARYTLEVADVDGYNPRSLLRSTDPIMSPAWSPNGHQIAYVSFEKKQASIYIQDLATGSRRLVSQYKGINGAPAWSPDGRKLALVLSKDGTPNIYVMDLASHNLTQITKDWSINTEPAWSPNGRTLIFTSNRSGGPQIYQKNLATGAVSRVTYDGNYNARASYTRDGNHIVVLNKEADIYNIGILDLNSGVFRVLTNSGNDSESPSAAPNGSMVLYGTLYNGVSVLGMTATDGSVQLRMPAREGEVQDPAWSPFLS
ncbi:MAG: Tol-Pal system beta propeller repeat protein TolB [Gammaproteobacteria bacterium]